MNPAEEIRIAALIIARNESSVIQHSVRRVKEQVGKLDNLYVVADHCTDATARLAAEAGAVVLERSEQSTTSKGAALAWFVQEHDELLQPYDYLLILDADTIIAENLFAVLRAQGSRQAKAVQCQIEPLIIDQSPISDMAAVAYFLDQKVADRIRSALGCSVRLRGTGMLIHPQILLEISEKIVSNVEDIALTLLINAAGIKITRLEEAAVYDPLPGSPAAASYQRARWYRGQWNAAWEYRREVIRLVLRGPCGWSLLGSLFLKPRIIYTAICSGLAFLLSRWPWISGLMWSQVVMSLLYLVIGFFFHPNRKKYLLSLAQFPLYLGMWLRSIWLSTTSSRWFKVR